MDRIVGSIASLAEHLIAVVTDAELYRPEACPHCRRSGMWCHGSYPRKADRSAKGLLNPVPVPYCFSSFPFFIHLPELAISILSHSSL